MWAECHCPGSQPYGSSEASGDLESPGWPHPYCAPLDCLFVLRPPGGQANHHLSISITVPLPSPAR